MKVFDTDTMIITEYKFSYEAYMLYITGISIIMMVTGELPYLTVCND
jgi:hypothetical protein